MNTHILMHAYFFIYDFVLYKVAFMCVRMHVQLFFILLCFIKVAFVICSYIAVTAWQTVDQKIATLTKYHERTSRCLSLMDG